MYWAIRMHLAFMLILDRFRVSARTAKIASRTSSVMLGRPTPPQPPSVDAASRACVPPGGRHPLQRPLAHPPQPQQRCLIGAEGLHFGDLGPAPLPQRRAPRVISGAGLPGTRAQRIPAAEPGLGLQQVRDAQPHHLALVIGQVIQARRLPGRLRRLSPVRNAWQSG